MPRIVVDATVRAQAPREVVWAVIADARSWQEWGGWDRTELEREGEPAPDGFGAIRRIVRGPVTVRERVDVWQPPSRFGYELLSGLPVREYHSVVTLTPSGADGRCTNLHWESRFDARVRLLEAPMRAFVQATLNDVARRVAREAERRAA